MIFEGWRLEGFTFEGGEKALGWRVVPAIAFATHALPLGLRLGSSLAAEQNIPMYGQRVPSNVASQSKNLLDKFTNCNVAVKHLI